MLNPEQIKEMAHSVCRNYAVPGLNSQLIGGNGFGQVRLFTCERDHLEPIVPHSHRYDFQCLVLAGSVTNLTWRRGVSTEDGDFFAKSEIVMRSMGKYSRVESPTGPDVARWRYTKLRYESGQVYSMKADDIHSIFFSRGAAVLFFEGPQIRKKSFVLEPWVNGEIVPLLETKPWMFQGDTN